MYYVVRELIPNQVYDKDRADLNNLGLLRNTCKLFQSQVPVLYHRVCLLDKLKSQVDGWLFRLAINIAPELPFHNNWQRHYFELFVHYNVRSCSFITTFLAKDLMMFVHYNVPCKRFNFITTFLAKYLFAQYIRCIVLHTSGAFVNSMSCVRIRYRLVACFKKFHSILPHTVPKGKGDGFNSPNWFQQLKIFLFF